MTTELINAEILEMYFVKFYSPRDQEIGLRLKLQEYLFREMYKISSKSFKVQWSYSNMYLVKCFNGKIKGLSKSCYLFSSSLTPHSSRLCFKVFVRAIFRKQASIGTNEQIAEYK